MLNSLQQQKKNYLGHFYRVYFDFSLSSYPGQLGLCGSRTFGDLYTDLFSRFNLLDRYDDVFFYNTPRRIEF